MGLAYKTLGVIINSTRENEEFDADMLSLIYIYRKKRHFVGTNNYLVQPNLNKQAREMTQ